MSRDFNSNVTVRCDKNRLITYLGNELVQCAFLLKIKILYYAMIKASLVIIL